MASTSWPCAILLTGFGVHALATCLIAVVLNSIVWLTKQTTNDLSSNSQTTHNVRNSKTHKPHKTRDQAASFGFGVDSVGDMATHVLLPGIDPLRLACICGRTSDVAVLLQAKVCTVARADFQETYFTRGINRCLIYPSKTINFAMRTVGTLPTVPLVSKETCTDPILPIVPLSAKEGSHPP
jgi:hypothetical protein